MSSSVRFDSFHDATATCRACGSPGLDHFYQVDNIPTTSNLLMTSREEAMNWTRGDLRLAQCSKCGFITNTAFNDETQKLTARYEATQAYSPTFGRFARELAQNWIDRYQLNGKKILEIGCGQGEFISMMCDLAGASGWGVDPIIDASRSTARVQFIADKFGPHLTDLHPDFIVCRHTLEHIADIATFLFSVRQFTGNRPTIFAIEVPDTRRVLNEAAFWDIYYEHCSYFDADSLLSALWMCGFVVVQSRLEFSGQYLVIEAKRHRASDTFATDSPPRNRDSRSFSEIRNTFARDCEAKVDSWRSLLTADAAKTIIWGSGSKAVGFLTTLGINKEVTAVVDINPAKHGTFLPGSGHEIIAPEKLREIRPDRVIVMNPVYLEEIGRSIAELGLTAQLIALD